MTDLIPAPLVKRDLSAPDARPLSERPAFVYLASLAEGSRRTMLYALDRIALKLSGDQHDALTLDWSKLRYPHTAAIRAWLMEEYQPATVNKMLSALRMALQHAWKLGQMSAEDCARARDIANLRYETIPAGRVISGDELATLFEICARDASPTGARDAALIAVLYSTGARRSSVVGIHLSDYDAHTGDVVIQAKGRKTLRAHLAGGARRAVDDWLARRGDTPGPLFCRVYKGGKIKPDMTLSTQTVYDVLRRRSGQSGLSPLTPHDMRRSFVTDLLKAGVDLALVQKMAGHASPATTARYDHRFHEFMRKASNQLDVPYKGGLV